MYDLGLLILRLTFGGLMAGHGAQKLFGLFEGSGVKGTANFFETALGLRPGERWVYLAGLSESGSGVLTALGFLNPLGPLMTLGPMLVAWGRVHWGKPIWNANGGAEQVLTNVSIAGALALIGPGAWSVDRLLGIKMPASLALLTAAGVVGGAYVALSQPRPEQPDQPQQPDQPRPTPEPVN